MKRDQAPRSLAESAGAGKKRCAMMVTSDCFYPESFSRGKPLPESDKNFKSGRNFVDDDSAPTTEKRRKIDEKAEENSRHVYVLSSDSASSSEENNGDGGVMAADAINQPIRDSGGSDELGDCRRDMIENGDSGKMDTNGIIWPMFKDLGGMDGVIREMKRDVLVQLHQFKLLRHLGVQPMARVLFQGPPGCGKTTLARAVANEAGVPFYEISAAKLMSGVSGACEENIRELFSKAYMRAPSIVFIDEIDSFTSKMEIDAHLNQLMACMDESCRLIKPVNHNTGSESGPSTPGYVLVIGATNRPDAIDPVLRGRFDREFVLGVPDEYERLQILSVLTCNLKDVGCDLAKIARCTMGFVGRDLAALVKKAGMLAVNQITAKFSDVKPRPSFSDEEMEKLSITMADYENAIRTVQPSSKIEELYTIPNTKWDDVVGLQLLKQEFDRHIVRPIKFPDVYKDLGKNLTTTFFLYGPSGCGKTMIVEALANEAGANFIHIKCPDLLNKYVDHSELVLVLEIILSNARTWSPCILFFDEMEALASEGSMVLLKLRKLLENASARTGVYIICATNRPIITPSLSFLCFYTSRTFPQGTFDHYMYVPLPNPEERGMILKALSGNKPIDANLDLMSLGKDAACENFSGADLSSVMKEAVLAAIDWPPLFDGGCRTPWTIKEEDFRRALKKISPTASPRNMTIHTNFSKEIFRRRGGTEAVVSWNEEHYKSTFHEFAIQQDF